MDSSLNDLPSALTAVSTRPLFVIHLDVLPYQVIGDVAGAFRRIGVMPGGTFHGSRLSGTVLPGGSDWQTVRSDGSTLLDVKLALQTIDGALIGMSYKGIRRGPADVMDRLGKGEDVDPATYYFRTTVTFETASHHAWLNGIVAAGIGYRAPTGVTYSIFEIL